MRFGEKLLWTWVFCALMVFAIADETASDGLDDVDREIHIGNNKMLCQALFRKFTFSAWSDICGDTDVVVVSPYSMRASENSENDMYEYKVNSKFGYHKSSGNPGGLEDGDFHKVRPQSMYSVLESLRASALLQALERGKLMKFDRNKIPPFFKKFGSSSSISTVGNKSRRDDQDESHPLYLI